jgi:U3 small nucleolar RNA-associated protein 6
MFKRLSQIFTDALRLHPSNADLWVYAAKYALDEHADMTQARGYFQRGLRFCKSQRNIWVQYGRLECIYIAKLFARRRILGLDQSAKEKSLPENTVEDTDADMITLPVITAEDINPTLGKDEGVDEGALETLSAAPAFSGAIPMAIFDAAMTQFSHSPIFARDFFDMALEFEGLPCLQKILNHIVDKQVATSPTSHHTGICHFRLPVAGIKVTSPDFPQAFGSSLGHLKKYDMNNSLAQEVVQWLQPLSENKELDPALHTVVLATLRRTKRVLQPEAGSEK